MKTIHLTDNTVITHENILNLGKAIALKAVKGSLRYAYGNLDYLHKDIINDLYHHNTMDNLRRQQKPLKVTFFCNG